MFAKRLKVVTTHGLLKATATDQGWLKPLSHIQNLPPNTSRPRLAEAPVTHSEPSPEHQPTKNLPPNTSRPRLAEAPVTHSEPPPEHQPTKNLPRTPADQGWLKPLSHIHNLPRTPADQGWLKPLSHIHNLPPNTSRPSATRKLRLAKLYITGLRTLFSRYSLSNTRKMVWAVELMNGKFLLFRRYSLPSNYR
ncbi:hypothetical protein Bbelb_339810 [Branchiostoma belcheri]|nr:hypothetical protein Bbelb_339810 [Branchiostoma belcheri]